MRYLLDLDNSGMAVRFELAMLMSGYESLEIDIARPEEETALGEVLGDVILWDKKHIVFPGSAPRRPPPPPSPRNSPPLDDDRDNYQSLSPH
jgi:hypothetical protein